MTGSSKAVDVVAERVAEFFVDSHSVWGWRSEPGPSIVLGADEPEPEQVDPDSGGKSCRDMQRPASLACTARSGGNRRWRRGLVIRWVLNKI